MKKIDKKNKTKNKTTKNKTTKNKTKKRAFTLIELLAVIIILGILMIIAIPSVTNYISNSRKNSYIATAKAIIDGARAKVNEGKLNLYDSNTTYYIPNTCINTENSKKSPYGDFTKAYVVVTYNLNGDGFKYYWTSTDTSKMGVKTITNYDELSIEDIFSNVNDEDININVGINGRENIEIYNSDCTSSDKGIALTMIDTNTEENINNVTQCVTDEDLVQGTEYVNGQYTYHYLEEYTNSSEWKSISSGWGVALTDVINNHGASTEAVTSTICTFINNEPVTSASAMFYNSQAESIDLSTFNTKRITNMFTMFRGTAANTLDLTNFDTSNVTNMESMFLHSTSTKLLINHGFNTSNVKNMQSMFSDSHFDSIDLSNFNTSKVVDMGNMFDSALVSSLDLSSFDTSNVEDMSGMFARTPNLTSIDISHFDTSKVTQMRSAFTSTGATNINVSNINTSNVTTMQTMFANCKVTSLDLSSFDTSKVKNMYGMFENSNNLTNIYVSELWNTSNVTDSNRMFRNASKLPNYSSNYVDKRKANYNSGGYLSYKKAPSN